MQKILTQRGREAFELLIANYSTKEIAKLVNVSDKTVRSHISNVMLKLGVKGRAQAVVEPLKLEELTLEQAGYESALFFSCNIRVQRVGEGIQDTMFGIQEYEAAVWGRKSIHVRMRTEEKLLLIMCPPIGREQPLKISKYCKKLQFFGFFYRKDWFCHTDDVERYKTIIHQIVILFADCG